MPKDIFNKYISAVNKMSNANNQEPIPVDSKAVNVEEEEKEEKVIETPKARRSEVPGNTSNKRFLSRKVQTRGYRSPEVILT